MYINRKIDNHREVKLSSKTMNSGWALWLLLLLAALGGHEGLPTRSLDDQHPSSPIVFVPGDGGSQLVARLNKTERVHAWCDLKSDWYDIWLNLHLLTPGVFDCLCDNLKLTYNSTTRTTQNSEGVEIRVPSFGNLESVAYLDIAKIKYTDYFENIIATLEKKNGYVRNENMVAAPFDWRKAPNELEEFFHNLTNLIADTYVHNNFQPVTIICHSMGCLHSLHLLNRQSENWKQVYVRRLITLGAPWQGSVKAVKAMLLGDNLGIPILSSTKLQALQSRYPSLMYLFPRAPTFAHRTLIQTPVVNISLDNFEALFEAAELPDQREIWRDVIGIAANLTAPNVELWCLYGSGFNTVNQLVFDKPQILDSKTKYQEIMGDGDGSVNLESLEACKQFKKQQKKPVFTRRFDKLNHINILRRPEPASFIADEIITSNSYRTRKPLTRPISVRG